MKCVVLLVGTFILAFALAACHKDSNPLPAAKDSTVTPAFATDSATGIAVVTETNEAGTEVNTLLFFNPDGTLRWKKDQLPEFMPSAPGYADGTLFLSTAYVHWNGTPGQSSYYGYGKIYAFDEVDGSVKWNYLDSNYASATPVAGGGEMYIPQQGFIQGFDPIAGTPNWGVGVANGLLWTPLIDGDTLYTATAPMYSGYYSIVAIDIKTKEIIWTTPIGYNPPEGIMIASGMVVFASGTGALMAVDKVTGVIIWSVQDEQYNGMHVASGNTLFAFDNAPNLGYTIPLGLRAFNLATGEQIWQAKLSKVPDQFGGLWMYGKYLCFYAYQYPNSYLQTVDPETGDSVSRVTVVNARYESPLLVGHRIYASKTWDNITNRSLPTPQMVVLDAGSLVVKDSVVIAGVQQITSMRVVGKSGSIY